MNEKKFDPMRPDGEAYQVHISGPPPQPYEYPEGWHLALTLLGLAVGTFLMALDTTIITVAIPQIATDFNSLSQVGWIGSAYLITLTSFQPIAGSCYKSFDPKYAFLVFMVVFEVGSVLCASAPVSEVFILGRAIAGIGAAGLLQGALGIITFISPLEKRPIAMASVISVFGISCSMGPVLGGVFVDRVSWRWCFWVNLPIGLAAFLLVVFSLHLKQIAAIPERQQSLVAKLKKVDVIGITLIIGFVACLCIALQDGGNTAPWNSARIIGLLVAAVVIKALFWFSQWKLAERALITVRFLTNRTVAFGSIFLFLDNMSNYLKLYYLPFYFQAVIGTTAIRSGVNYIALAVPQFLALLLSGALVTKYGHYMPVILVGQVICAVGTGLLTRVNMSTSTVEWAVAMVLTGIGLGMGINAPHIAIQAVMETDTDVFLANGVATFFSQLGGTIAIPIGNAFILNALTKYIPVYTDNDLNAHTIIEAGPLAVPHLTSDRDTIFDIRLAYSKAIQHILIFALVVVCVSIPAAAGMQWLNLRTVANARNKMPPQNVKGERDGEPMVPGTI